jgi:hypothetical protein
MAAGGPALAGLRERFPTGALATLELDVERWRDLDHGTGTAVALVTPGRWNPKGEGDGIAHPAGCQPSRRRRSCS